MCVYVWVGGCLCVSELVFVCACVGGCVGGCVCVGVYIHVILFLFVTIISIKACVSHNDTTILVH